MKAAPTKHFRQHNAFQDFAVKVTAALPKKVWLGHDYAVSIVKLIVQKIGEGQSNKEIEMFFNSGRVFEQFVGVSVKMHLSVAICRAKEGNLRGAVKALRGIYKLV